MKYCTKRNTAIVTVLVFVATILMLTLPKVISGSTAAVTGNAAGAGAGAAEASGSRTIPISDIGTDAKFYEYTSSGGKTVRFFAVKDSSGTVRTAFDACDVCYQFHKGFRQEAGYMVCNNCGKRYAIDTIGTENKAGGGCWPGYLPSAVTGSSVAVSKADLEAGAWRF